VDLGTIAGIIVALVAVWTGLLVLFFALRPKGVSVREVVGVEVRLLHEGLLRAVEEGGLAVLEHLLVALQVFLIQRCGSVTLPSPRWTRAVRRTSRYLGKKGRGVLSGAGVKSR
jgi:hypothetical protein